jgi:hypothetical protein
MPVSPESNLNRNMPDLSVVAPQTPPVVVIRVAVLEAVPALLVYVMVSSPVVVVVVVPVVTINAA